jgi:hypothetical protein
MAWYAFSCASDEHTRLHKPIIVKKADVKNIFIKKTDTKGTKAASILDVPI